MSRRMLGSVLALALAAALRAGTAAAQEPQAPSAQPTAQPAPAEGGIADKDIEVITVTSRLREESIQDVPIAVSQFGQEAIESIAPSTLRDFDGLTPNLFIGMNTAGPGASAIYLRGLGYADIEKTQTPNVGVVLDGVFIPSSTGQLIDTFDIESLEINRGPQAILWGRNTSGGTIVVRRSRPEFDDWGAKLYASYGDYDGEGEGRAFKGQAVANIPLVTEQMALRIGYTYKDEDGYARNERTGEDRGAVNYEAFNAKLLWEPIEELSLLFNWDWIEDRSDIPPQDPRFDGDDPYINRSDRDPEELAPYNVSVTSLEANYDLPWNLRLTSISAYWDSHDLVYQDFDGGFSSYTNPASNDPSELFARLHTRREQEFDVFSQELRLAGSALDESLTYTMGFYYAREDHDHAQRTEQVLQGSPFLMQVLVPSLFNGTDCVTILGVLNGPIHPTQGQFCTLPAPRSLQRTFLTNKSWAVFGSLEYELPWVEGLRVNAGVRWIDETKKFDSRFDNIEANGSIVGEPVTSDTPCSSLPPGSSPCLTTEVSGLSDSWDDVVFEAGVNYQVLENLLVYYRFAQGFRSGGFSLRAADPTVWTATFEPENTDSHEIGLKSSWLDGRLVANFAAFHNKIKGSQGSSIISGVTSVGTTTLILNGGVARVYGVELETRVEVLEGLDVDFTLGWQKVGDNESVQNTHNLPFALGGTVCTFLLGVPSTGEPGCPNVSFTDQELARVPELTWAVGASYRWLIGPGEFQVATRYRHNDDFWIIPPSIPDGSSVPTNTPVFQEGYSLLEANVGYEWTVAERKVRVGLVGKNLTDKQYKEQELPLGNGGFRGWGPPRYVGGEITFEL